MKQVDPSFVVLVGLVLILEVCIYFVAVGLSETYSISTQNAYVLDRFEDNGWAVLEREAGVTFDFPKASLPTDTQQGDVLVFKRFKDGTLLVYRDEAAEARRRQEIMRLRERIPRVPDGDVES